VRDKLTAVLKTRGLHAILCVGERSRSTSSGDHFSFIAQQIRSALKKRTPKDLKRIIIAYEPIWAIGKRAQDAMTSHEVHEMSLFIRKHIARLFDRKTARNIKLLYGGSAERGNAEALLKDTGMQGFLVGHASLDAEHFADICKIASLAKL